MDIGAKKRQSMSETPFSLRFPKLRTIPPCQDFGFFDYCPSDLIGCRAFTCFGFCRQQFGMSVSRTDTKEQLVFHLPSSCVMISSSSHPPITKSATSRQGKTPAVFFCVSTSLVVVRSVEGMKNGMWDVYDAVTPLPISPQIKNDHLEYAITWFSLAAVWLGMTLFWILRIRRRSEES